MKVKLINTVQQAGTNTIFHKGKTYNATPATNQPGFLRLTQKGAHFNLKKVFVTKSGDPNGMLVNSSDFEVIDFPEAAEVLANYKASKVKKPREKKIVKTGLVLREGFRPFNPREQTPKYVFCTMNIGRGADRHVCNRGANFVKVLEGKKKIKIPRCERCATFTEKVVKPVPQN